MSTFRKSLAQFVSGFRDSLYGVYKFMQRQYALNNKLNAATTDGRQRNNSSSTVSQQPALTTNTIVANGANGVNNNNNKSILAKNNEKLLQRLFQSCILNGIFLLLCIVVFNYLLMPVLNLIGYKVISERYHGFIPDYLNPTIHLLFSFVWIMPVFFLSKVFNVLCHQEIADIAYKQKYGKPRTFDKFTLSGLIADTAFSITMQIIFLVQSSLLMTLVPNSMLNSFLCHLHLSFLYSLYAFEYKFCNMGWDIRKRIYHIESRWPYYLGFGLSLSLVLSLASSYIINATLFATLFPAFILSAIESDSERLASVKYYRQHGGDIDQQQQRPLTLRLFKPAIYLTDFLFKVFTSNKTNNKLTSNTTTGVTNPSTNTRPQSSTVPVLNIRKTN